MRQAFVPVGSLAAVQVEEIAATEVGPGCWRRDLPGIPGLRAWIVDMAPGSQWPHVDSHPHGELFYVVSGEVIEGGQRYGAGMHVAFHPGSEHRPCTETGVRLYGLNPLGAA